MWYLEGNPGCVLKLEKPYLTWLVTFVLGSKIISLLQGWVQNWLQSYTVIFLAVSLILVDDFWFIKIHVASCDWGK